MIDLRLPWAKKYAENRLVELTVPEHGYESIAIAPEKDEAEFVLTSEMIERLRSYCGLATPLDERD